MGKFIGVIQAKEEIRRLIKFVDLVESYEADTLEKLIVKEYAYINSIEGVIRILKTRGIEVDKGHVLEIIRSHPKDEVHQIVKSGYLIKTRTNRRK